MIKDFESEERHLNCLKKTKNKFKSENKKHLLKLEQIKEKIEEDYNNKRKNLLKEFSKKQQDIQRQLYKTRISKQSDWKKNSILMQKKEVQAKEKRKLKIERDEKERRQIETQIFSKCKIIKYI